MKFLKKYAAKLTVTAVIVMYIIVCVLLKRSCIILELTGYPCPGCGMTRALTAALRLSFGEAFGYHPMFWSVPVLYVSFLKDGRLFKNKLLNTAVHLLILGGFAANYLLKLIF